MTRKALEKLTTTQRRTLDTYKEYLKKDYHGDGVNYRNRIYGYITALLDSGFINEVEARSFKIYFTL